MPRPRQGRRQRRLRRLRPAGARAAAGSPSRQIEAARIAMTRHIKRGGKVCIRIFPDKPITKKPAETRMGNGKGGVEDWVAVVKPGPRDVRDRRRRREAGARGVPPRAPQAADPDAHRHRAEGCSDDEERHAPAASIRESTDDELEGSHRAPRGGAVPAPPQARTRTSSRTRPRSAATRREIARVPDDPDARARSGIEAGRARRQPQARGEVVMAETQNPDERSRSAAARAASSIGIVTSDKMQKTVVVAGHAPRPRRRSTAST